MSDEASHSSNTDQAPRFPRSLCTIPPAKHGESVAATELAEAIVARLGDRDNIAETARSADRVIVRLRSSVMLAAIARDGGEIQAIAAIDDRAVHLLRKLT